MKKLILAILFGLSALVPVYADVTTNVTAYYKLDESSGNPVDSSGNGFTLTNNNTVGFAAGKINNGADFGSSNTNKDFSIPTGFTDFNSNAAWSISFWMKTTGGNGFIGTRCNSSAFAQWNIFYFQSAATRQILFEISPANSAGNRMSVKNTTGPALNDGAWHHVVITYNGSRLTSGLKIYVDGSSQTVADDSANTLSSNAPTGIGGAIGSRTSTFGSYFSGMTDEWGFWTKELTAADVTSLYNGGSGLQYPFTVAASTPSTMGFFRMFHYR